MTSPGLRPGARPVAAACVCAARALLSSRAGTRATTTPPVSPGRGAWPVCHPHEPLRLCHGPSAPRAAHAGLGRRDPRGLRGRGAGCAAVGLGAAALCAYYGLPRLYQRGHPGEVTEALLAQGLTAHGLPAGDGALHSVALRQRLQQHLGLLQVGRIEALSEPAGRSVPAARRPRPACPGCCQR